MMIMMPVRVLIKGDLSSLYLETVPSKGKKGGTRHRLHSQRGGPEILFDHPSGGLTTLPVPRKRNIDQRWVFGVGGGGQVVKAEVVEWKMSEPIEDWCSVCLGSRARGSGFRGFRV